MGALTRTTRLYALLLVPLVLMLVLDAVWLTVAKRMYQSLVRRVQCGANLRVRAAPAIVTYVLMFLGLVGLVLPAMRAGQRQGNAQGKALGDLRLAVTYGGLYGLALYGVFNATNLAIFKDYAWGPALVDTLWGTSLCTLLAYVMRRIG